MTQALGKSFKFTRKELSSFEIPSARSIRSGKSTYQPSFTQFRVERPANPKSRADILFRSVKRSINARGPEEALRASQKIELASAQSQLHPSIRAEFLQRCIDGFLAAGHWDLAYRLYHTMKTESLPGCAEAIAKLLRKSVEMRSPRPMLSTTIGDATLILKQVDEPELCAILAHLVRTEADIDIIRSLITGFQERKSYEWKPAWKVYALLAQAEAQNGYILAAEEYFVKSKREIENMKRDKQVTPTEYHSLKQKLYTNLFTGYATFGRDLPKVFNQILLRMQKDKTAPTQKIANSVIELHRRNGEGNKAFAFYRAMRHSDPIITPNATTFRHLFSMLVPPHSSYWELAYDRRRLFKYMANQHAVNTECKPKLPSDALGTAVLNAALRLFMVKQDYAAASVTIKTFPVCSVDPNAQTRSYIVDTLRKRIAKELANPDLGEEPRWSDRMLGEVIQIWDDKWRFTLGSMLIRTVRQFAGSVCQAGIDIGMLLALLRRAIICSGNLWPGKDLAQEDALVDKEISRAVRHMLPKRLDTSEWYTRQLSV